MKLNLNFYQQENISDNKIDETLEIITNCESIKYENELKNKDISTRIFNNLSSIRQNSICWYEFKRTESVLEIGTEYGVITDLLCDKFDRVVSVDWNKKRAEKVSSLLEKKENLEIIVGKLDEISLNEKFDYITLLSDYTNYEKIGIGDLEKIFYIAKKYLKEDGTILFATDNKFGIKYFIGAAELNENVLGSSVQKSFSKNNPLPSKDMIQTVLRKLGFAKYRFFYPLPDYHMPAVIFTDEYLPKKNDSKLMYPLNYLEDSFVVMNENKILKQVANENKFDFFTNSYLIEISNSDLKTKNDEVLYISFNNSRKEEYRTITKIKKDVVEKEARDINLNEHISNIGKNIEILNRLGFPVLDSYDKDKNIIISKFCDYEQLSSFFMELIRKNEIEKVYQFLKEYYDILKKKLGKNEDISDVKENNILTKLNVGLTIEEQELFYTMYITKNGYTDLVFENIFFSEEKNEYFLFDQEWYFENTPIEYIVYRALNNIYIYGDLEKYYPMNNILEEFNFIQYKSIFDKIEKKFQENIICNERIDQILKSNKRIEPISTLKQKLENNNEKIRSLEKELQDTLECFNVLRNQKSELEQNLATKEEELKAIYASKSWNTIQKVKEIMKGNKD